MAKTKLDLRKQPRSSRRGSSDSELVFTDRDESLDRSRAEKPLPDSQRRSESDAVSSKSRRSQLSILFRKILAILLVVLGFGFGFLPFLQGWVLALAGLLIYLSTKPDDWRFPAWFDKRIPEKIRHKLYKDLRKADHAKRS